MQVTEFLYCRSYLNLATHFQPCQLVTKYKCDSQWGLVHQHSVQKQGQIAEHYGGIPELFGPKFALCDRTIMAWLKEFGDFWIGHTWRKNLRFSSGSGKITSLLLRDFSGAGRKPEGFLSKCDQTIKRTFKHMIRTFLIRTKPYVGSMACVRSTQYFTQIANDKG